MAAAAYCKALQLLLRLESLTDFLCILVDAVIPRIHVWYQLGSAATAGLARWSSIPLACICWTGTHTNSRGDVKQPVKRLVEAVSSLPGLLCRFSA